MHSRKVYLRREERKEDIFSLTFPLAITEEGNNLRNRECVSANDEKEIWLFLLTFFKC
jgi:hypothetical protein